MIKKYIYTILLIYILIFSTVAGQRTIFHRFWVVSLDFIHTLCLVFFWCSLQHLLLDLGLLGIYFYAFESISSWSASSIISRVLPRTLANLSWSFFSNILDTCQCNGIQPTEPIFYELMKEGVSEPLKLNYSFFRILFPSWCFSSSKTLSPP